MTLKKTTDVLFLKRVEQDVCCLIELKFILSKQPFCKRENMGQLLIRKHLQNFSQFTTQMVITVSSNT